MIALGLLLFATLGWTPFVAVYVHLKYRGRPR